MPYIGNTAANRFVASKAATQFSGDGSETQFTLDHSVSSDEDILVSVDGVIQEPSVAYSVSGTTLTFTAAPSSNAGNNIFVYYLFRTVGTVSHPSTNSLEATSGAFSGTLSVTGNQTNTGDVTVNGAFTSQGIDDNADSTAITIDSSENVGIGTSSLDGKLHIEGSQLGGTAGDDSKLLQLGNPDVSNVTTYRFHNYRYTNGTSHSSSEMRFQRKVDVTEQGYVGLRDAAVTFGYGTTERMRVDNNGKILMGMTSTLVDSPNNPLLQVQGSLGTHQSNASNNQTCVVFQNDNGRVGFIDTNANSVTYNTTSDYRLKENVSYTWDATTRIKQLKPCKFNFITEPSNTIEGFLAHEVSSIVPQAVSGTKDAVDDNGNIINQAIDQSKLVPLLVKTIQELEARITALENA